MKPKKTIQITLTAAQMYEAKKRSIAQAKGQSKQLSMEEYEAEIAKDAASATDYNPPKSED